jgi:hypothetical protein
LRTLAEPLPEAEVVETLLAAGIAARLIGDLDGAARYLGHARARAERLDDGRLLGEVMLSLSSVLYLSGRVQDAFNALDSGSSVATPSMAARYALQRGTFFARIGRPDEAYAAFTEALPGLEAGGDRGRLADLLSNRARLELAMGDAEGADRDFARAADAYRAEGSWIDVAACEHGRGEAAALAGDLVDALRRMEVAEADIARLNGAEWEIQVARCDVLLAAGLFSDAHDLAISIAEQMMAHGLHVEAAEATLAAAESAWLAGDPRAEALAGSAISTFTSQGRTGWRARARGLLAAIREPEGATEALAAADELAEAGMNLSAARVYLVAARSAVRTGDAGTAGEALKRARATAVAEPLDVRIQRALTESIICRAAGDRRRAASALVHGFRALAAQQATLAATDVRAGVARHAAALAAEGVTLALAGRRPRAVWRWADRARSMSIGTPPVAAPPDERVRQLTAELRAAARAARAAGGEDELELARRQILLEARLRRSLVTQEGPGGLSAHGSLAVDAVLDRLSDRTLVQFEVAGGRLIAITARRRRVSLTDLGEADPVLAVASRLGLALGRLAASIRPGMALSRVSAGVDVLRERVVFPLRLGDDAMVLIPTGPLVDVPWSTVLDRPTSLAPSTALWATAGMPSGAVGPPLAVAGPDLATAGAEVEAVVSVHPGADALVGAGATTGAVSEAMDGRSLVHLACHGSFRSDQPLFSSFRLSDGDLYLHEVERLADPPATVVAASCHMGRVDSSWREHRGFAASLLAMGTRSVVAPVVAVPEGEALAVFVTHLHRRLAAGATAPVAADAARRAVAEDPIGRAVAAAFTAWGA